MDAVVKSIVMRMLPRMRSMTRRKERQPKRVPFLQETLFFFFFLKVRCFGHFGREKAVWKKEEWQGKGE